MNLVRAKEQPPEIEFATADGIFIKQMYIANKGTYIPQHSHDYDHSSMLATGSVRVWKNDFLLGDYSAPTVIFITAGAKHKFLSLEDNTLVYCIHNISRTGEVEIKEHHDLGV